MANQTFSFGDEGKAKRRYVGSLAFCLGSVACSAGLIVWCIGLLQTFGSQIGLWFLLTVFLVQLVVFLWQSFRLLFEIKGATLHGDSLTLSYRCLSERRVSLPYVGHVARKVRLIDLLAETNIRFANVVSRSLFDRVLIPLELNRSAELTQLLEHETNAL